jgi:hypothetical protein
MNESGKFGGFKARLYADVESFSCAVDIRYRHITAREVLEKLQIIMVDDKGKQVFKKRTNEYRYIYVNEDGEEVAKSQIHYIQVLENGEVREVVPFRRTKELKTLKLIEMAKVDMFLPEAIYEIWSDDIETMRKLAIALRDADKAIVTKLSFGGFSEYYGIIYPVFKDNSFVLQMVLTRTRKEFSAWMPLEEGKVEAVEKAEEQAPVIKSVLPEI